VPVSQPADCRTRSSHAQRLLERARVELNKLPAHHAALQRQRLGARVGRVLERFEMGKFIRWEVIDGRLSWSFDQNKIAAEKTL